MLKQFDILSKLGEGGFGQVYKVKRKSDQSIYVMKQISLSQMNQRAKQETLKEVQILSSLNNQYIVRYYESFIEKNTLYIIMEFCERGDLHKYLKSQMGRPLSENTIWAFLIQITIALSYLHSKKILHRDIKTMNVFLAKNNQVRIGDLGVAKVLSDDTNFAKTFVGTPYYLSPEMCEEKPYNEKSDIWAFGCLLYELCTSKHPFDARNQAALIMRIIRGTYEPVTNKYYSSALTDIVHQCLQKDFRARPKAWQILQNASVIQQGKQLKLELNINQTHNKVEQKKEIKEEQVQEQQKKIEEKKEENIMKGQVQQKQNNPLIPQRLVQQKEINPPKFQYKPPVNQKVQLSEKQQVEQKDPVQRHQRVQSTPDKPLKPPKLQQQSDLDKIQKQQEQERQRIAEREKEKERQQEKELEIKQAIGQQEIDDIDDFFNEEPTMKKKENDIPVTKSQEEEFKEVEENNGLNKKDSDMKNQDNEGYSDNEETSSSKRKSELEQVFEMKKNMYGQKIGKQKLEEILKEYRKRLELDIDQDEMDDQVEDDKWNLDDETMYGIYKLLNLEIEINNCS